MPDDNRVLFFERDQEAFGFLSNFHPAPLNLDGESWPTVEHYYQCQKSLNPGYRDAIRAEAPDAYGPVKPYRARICRPSPRT